MLNALGVVQQIDRLLGVGAFVSADVGLAAGDLGESKHTPHWIEPRAIPGLRTNAVSS